ncbi:hypothetical protein KSP40_PGU003642 [Platanthera guangdongensis]|uniref:Uncharacterized protein n=1 Tax=Platanthera guangdongensis TaxID=2320717 RepID=A0ABR2MC79_9ASPA
MVGVSTATDDKRWDSTRLIRGKGKTALYVPVRNFSERCVCSWCDEGEQLLLGTLIVQAFHGISSSCEFQLFKLKGWVQILAADQRTEAAYQEIADLKKNYGSLVFLCLTGAGSRDFGGEDPAPTIQPRSGPASVSGHDVLPGISGSSQPCLPSFCHGHSSKLLPIPDLIGTCNWMMKSIAWLCREKFPGTTVLLFTRALF